MGASLWLFYGFASLALLGACAMVAAARNIVVGMLGLLLCVVSLSGIYVLLDAQFVAVLQLIAYAGIVLVLFLFAIMLADVEADAFGPSRKTGWAMRAVGVLATVWLAIEISTDALLAQAAAPLGPVPDGFGGFRSVGEQLFTRYVVPLEIVALLLLSAIVGAVVVARRARPMKGES